MNNPPPQRGIPFYTLPRCLPAVGLTVCSQLCYAAFWLFSGGRMWVPFVHRFHTAARRDRSTRLRHAATPLPRRTARKKKKKMLDVPHLPMLSHTCCRHVPLVLPLPPSLPFHLHFLHWHVHPLSASASSCMNCCWTGWLRVWCRLVVVLQLALGARH